MEINAMISQNLDYSDFIFRPKIGSLHLLSLTVFEIYFQFIASFITALSKYMINFRVIELIYRLR